MTIALYYKSTSSFNVTKTSYIFFQFHALFRTQQDRQSLMLRHSVPHWKFQFWRHCVLTDSFSFLQAWGPKNNFILITKATFFSSRHQKKHSNSIYSLWLQNQAYTQDKRPMFCYTCYIIPNKYIFSIVPLFRKVWQLSKVFLIFEGFKSNLEFTVDKK